VKSPQPECVECGLAFVTKSSLCRHHTAVHGRKKVSNVRNISQQSLSVQLTNKYNRLLSIVEDVAEQGELSRVN